MPDPLTLVDEPDFDQLVSDYYQSLYRFALSLAEREAEACDLTQQTFFLWASKGQQLRDRSKVKSWLFTTLHREFLGSRRRNTRFPHHEIESVERELPPVTPATVNELDADTVLQALTNVDEVYRAPLMLFYLEDHSYLEIAAVLEVKKHQRRAIDFIHVRERMQHRLGVQLIHRGGRHRRQLALDRLDLVMREARVATP